MKYDHIVKANGEYYQAGTEVPDPKEVVETLQNANTHQYSDSEIILETEPARRGRPRKN